MYHITHSHHFPLHYHIPDIFSANTTTIMPTNMFARKSKRDIIL